MTPTLPHRLRDERGFTLVEMLTSMAVLGILFALFATVMSTTITHGTQEQVITELQTEARAAIERFAQEVRQAHSGDDTWPIQYVDSPTQTIRFLSADRLQPFHLRQIEWRLSSGALQRRSVTSTDTDGFPWTFPTPITSATWVTQVRTVRNPTVFAFLDENDNPAANVTDVRRVDITIEISTVGEAARVYRYQTSATPRVTP